MLCLSRLIYIGFVLLQTKNLSCLKEAPLPSTSLPARGKSPARRAYLPFSHTKVIHPAHLAAVDVVLMAV